MNHQDKVNEIIDVLLDTAYEWIGKLTTPDGHIFPSHLTKDYENTPICGTVFSMHTTLDTGHAINPDDWHHSYDICHRCLKIIEDNPTKYGFHKTGVNIYAELADDADT